MNPHSLPTTDIHQLELIARGKVRDIYQVGLHDLLFVATDRLSAFDVVLPTPIPDKGVILNHIAQFWFGLTREIIPNHLTGLQAVDVIGEHPQLDAIARRSVVVKKLRPLPFEAIVRGYLAGSGWKDYQHTGHVSGVNLPPDMELATALPSPIFTPSTKAAAGHDENIDMAALERLIGADLAHKVRDVSIKLYQFAREYAAGRGIIIADTKFEFGIDETGGLVLMDEILTPDSSRFWPADEYCVGANPPSFDKQFVRDYLERSGWDKTPPAPELDQNIVEQTRSRYIQAYEQLTGLSFEDIS